MTTPIFVSAGTVDVDGQSDQILLTFTDDGRDYRTRLGAAVSGSVATTSSPTSTSSIALDHGTITMLRRHLDAHHGDPAGSTCTATRSGPTR